MNTASERTACCALAYSTGQPSRDNHADGRNCFLELKKCRLFRAMGRLNWLKKYY